MQTLDFEDTVRHRPRQASQCGMILLRKYSLAICFVESMAIVVFIFLLLKAPPDPSSQLELHKIGNVSLSEPYRTYSNGVNSSKFLVGTVKSCCQRKHDQRASIRCQSSDVELCRRVEQSEQQDAIKQSSTERLVATVVVTSKAGARLDSKTIELKRVQHSPADSLKGRFATRLEIRPYVKHQTILGWGGALTDTTINNILSLTTNGTRRLLNDYFDKDGLMFNMVRITIGGSDFSSRFYTNDDSLTDDFKMKNFKLKEEDLLYKIPLIKFIQDEYNLPGRELKLFASMWSPPIWMKTNHHFNKGFLKGSIDDEPIDPSNPAGEESYYDALAELKVKFLHAYRNNSISFWGLTVMNEPLFAAQPFLDFNTMIFPKDDYANYVAKYLGPKIKNNPNLNHIILMAHDDNRRYLANFTIPILDHKRVKQFIDGVSVHGYTDEAYDLMDKIYERYHGVDDPSFFVIPTELCSGHLPFMEKALIGNWHRGMHYALDIIHSLQHSAAGWVDWNMALDLKGGPGWLGGRLDAPIIIDKFEDAYHKSPMFYVLGQFSRYVPPSSVRVNTQILNDIYDNHFETVTFSLPDKPEKLATIIVNNNPYPIDLNIKILNDQQDGTTYLFKCDADSVTTLIYPKRSF